jgi:hypothetical protein
MSEINAIATNNYLLATQPKVSHDNTLSGNGTVDSPLGLNETVIYSSTSAVPSGQSFTLSESPTNFDSVKIYCIHNEANTGWNEIFEYKGDAIRYDIVLNATDNANDLIFDRYSFTRTDNNVAVGVRARHIIGNTVSKASLANPLYISKVIGINRISGGNA